MAGSILGRWVQIKRVNGEPVFGILDKISNKDVFLSQVTKIGSTETFPALKVQTSNMTSLKVMPIPMTSRLPTFTNGSTSSDKQMTKEINGNDEESDTEFETSTFQLLRVTYDGMERKDLSGWTINHEYDSDEDGSEDFDDADRSDVSDDDSSPDWEEGQTIWPHAESDEDDYTEAEIDAMTEQDWVEYDKPEEFTVDETMLMWYQEKLHDVVMNAVKLTQGVIDGIEHGPGHSMWMRIADRAGKRDDEGQNEEVDEYADEAEKEYAQSDEDEIEIEPFEWNWNAI